MDRKRSLRRNAGPTALDRKCGSPEPVEVPGAQGKFGNALRETVSCWLMVFAVSLCLAPTVASAQVEVGEAPNNAHAKRYGSGWGCDRGYRKIDQTCVPITVPVGGYLDASGDGWKCDRSFHQSGSSCVALEIPPQAHLGRSGGDWDCDRGHRRSGNGCVAVEVPRDGFLGPSGRDWECERDDVRSQESPATGNTAGLVRTYPSTKGKGQ